MKAALGKGAFREIVNLGLSSSTLVLLHSLSLVLSYKCEGCSMLK